MKPIYLYLGFTLLLLVSTPSIAQSTRLDSLNQINQQIAIESKQLEEEYDKVHQRFAECTNDEQRLIVLADRDKLDKRAQKLGNKARRVEEEILLEKARLEQIEREEQLAKKHAAAQAASPVPLKGELNGYAWVDLALPSGTKWATYNIGTTNIHGVGTRIAWAELSTKKTFSPSAYHYNDTLILSYAGNAQYDLATAQWGEGWYTPTKEQWDELIEHCDWEYVMINGINGVLFTSHKTYNTIFLPSTGYTDDETYKLKHTTYNLAYWTSTGWSNNGAHSYIANYEHGYMTITNRYIAHCVRAVCGVSSEVVEAREVTTEIVQTAEEATTVEAETAQTQESNQKKQDNNKKKQEKKPSAEKTARTVKNVVKTINTLNRIFR